MTEPKEKAAAPEKERTSRLGRGIEHAVHALDPERFLEVKSTGLIRKSLHILGELSAFGWQFLRSAFVPPYEFQETVRQTYNIGVGSFLLVMIVSIVIGAVLTMQTRPTMIKFGAEAFIPTMVGISVMRELVPVLVSVIVGGRVGAGIGAELGSMRVTEQIEAMEVAALDPFKLLVVTRVIGCMIALPILVVFGDALGLFGAYVVNKIEAGTSLTLFVNSLASNIEFSDYVPGVIKTIFFGFTIGLVGCYEGFTSTGGTEGVGKSATDAVVICSLLIIVSDVLFVKLTLLLWG